MIGTDISEVEFSWPIGRPLVGYLNNGLWEVRSNLTNSRISRIIFSTHNGHMVLLHGFIKKTRKTPKQDLDIAVNRKFEASRNE